MANSSFFLALVFLGYALAQINFLPTEYSSNTPLQFDVERVNFALSMALCNETLYQGCTMTAVFNLPFTAWSIEDGTYTQFRVAGIGDDCATIACQNDYRAPQRPNECAFVYNTRLGNRLVAYGESGRSAGFQATFNMKIVCPSTETQTQTIQTQTIQTQETKPTYAPSGLKACPLSVATKRGIKLVTPGKTPTSPLTSRATKYSLSVCPSSLPTAKVTYSLQASDQLSAFASYFCAVSNCNTDTSQLGWFDRSGTAANLITITKLGNQLVWFNIYGWGGYNQDNSYVFNIQVDDEN